MTESRVIRLEKQQDIIRDEVASVRAKVSSLDSSLKHIDKNLCRFIDHEWPSMKGDISSMITKMNNFTEDERENIATMSGRIDVLATTVEVLATKCEVIEANIEDIPVMRSKFRSIGAAATAVTAVVVSVVTAGVLYAVKHLSSL